MRQGVAIFAAMGIILVAAFAGTYIAEKSGNPYLPAQVVQADGNMEGKEVRFGVVNSTLWATATTAASNGSVNSMHDSYPGLNALNIMGLQSPESAILSAVIFNALIIIALIPLAIKGVKYQPASASDLDCLAC